MYCNFRIRLPHFENMLNGWRKKSLHNINIIRKFCNLSKNFTSCYMCPWYVRERFVFLRIELDSPGCNGPDKIFFVMVIFYHSNSRHIFIFLIFYLSRHILGSQSYEIRHKGRVWLSHGTSYHIFTVDCFWLNEV